MKCLLASVLLSLAAASGAVAAPPTLTGEGMYASNFSPVETPSSVRYTSCVEHPDGRLTLSYVAHGTAGGPYGGRVFPPYNLAPFEETGELTISPYFRYGDAVNGDLVAFHADFTIHSDAGTVTGTKTLVNPDDFQLAGCFSGSGGQGATLILQASGLSYTAKIYTPEGEFSDRGTATFELIDTQTTTNFGNLTQQLTSALTAPEPACADGLDNDRDGRTDFGPDRGCSAAGDTDESGFLWGNATAGRSFSAMSVNVKRASPYLLWYDDATVTKLRAYIDGRGAPSGSQQVRGVIYRLGRRVAETEPVTIHAGDLGSWVELPLESPVELDRGYYLLGLLTGPDHGVARYAWDAGGPSSRRYNVDVFPDGASDPFGSAFTDSQRMSIFALGDTAPPPSGG